MTHNMPLLHITQTILQHRLNKRSLGASSRGDRILVGHWFHNDVNWVEPQQQPHTWLYTSHLPYTSYLTYISPHTSLTHHLTPPLHISHLPYTSHTSFTHLTSHLTPTINKNHNSPSCHFSTVHNHKVLSNEHILQVKRWWPKTISIK